MKKKTDECLTTEKERNYLKTILRLSNIIEQNKYRVVVYRNKSIPKYSDYLDRLIRERNHFEEQLLHANRLIEKYQNKVEQLQRLL
jgi:hypothetical protein